MPEAGIILNNLAAERGVAELNMLQSALDSETSALSTGRKTRGPQYNPANYAISQRLQTQVQGYGRALANASTGTSLIQTASAAMGQQLNLLQKLHSLAVEAANGSNAASDRAALQTEASQLLGQLQAIAEQSQFNGKPLLNGSFGGQSLQVGSQQEQIMTVSLPNTQTQVLGSYELRSAGSTFRSSGALTEDGFYPGAAYSFSPGGVGNWSSGIGSSGLQIVGEAGSARVNISSEQGSAASLANGVNSVEQNTGVRALATTSAAFTVHSGSYHFYISAGRTGDLRNPVAISAVVPPGPGGKITVSQLSSLVQAINAQSLDSGVTAQVALRNGTPNLILSSLDGNNINISASVPISGVTVSPNEIHTSGFTIVTGTVISSGSTTQGGVFSGIIATDDGQALSGEFSLQPGIPLPPSGSTVQDKAVHGRSTFGLSNGHALPSGCSILQATIVNTGGQSISGTTYRYGAEIQGLVLTPSGQVFSGTFQYPLNQFFPTSSTQLARGTPVPTQTLLRTPPGVMLGPALASGSTGSLIPVDPQGQAIVGAYSLTSGTSNVSLQGVVQFASSAPYTVHGAEKIGLSSHLALLHNNRMSDLNLSTAWSAQKAMLTTKEAIQGLTQTMAALGALQQGLQQRIMSDQTDELQSSAAHSTVTDANIAATTARLTQAKILQEAGISTIRISQSLLRAYLKLLP